MLNFIHLFQIPRINIQYGKLLDPIFNFYLKNNPDLKKSGWNDWTPPSREQISERIKRYREIWSKDERKILRSICRKTGLFYKRNEINAYIVSGNNRQFSNPIIIKSGYTPEDFVEILTHELIHRLFNINSKIIPGCFFKEMFPNETESVQEHVITHALLKYVYLDVLKDRGHIEKSIINSKDEDYIRAWRIVEENGYKKLLKDFKAKLKRRGYSCFRHTPLQVVER